MKVWNHVVELKKPDDVVKIYFLGDMHLGSKNSAKEELDQAIKDIIADKCEHKFFFGMGDIADAITPKDKRYSFENTDAAYTFINDQYEYFEKYLMEMQKHGIRIGLHIGNHSNTFIRNTNTAFLNSISKRHGFMYFGFAASHILSLRHQNKLIKKWRIFTTHGASNSRTPGGAINALENMKKSFFQDCFIQGHNHRLSDDIETTLYQKNGHLVNRYEWLGNSGSFLRTYAENTINYAEEKLYNPLVIGFLSGTFTKDRMFLSKHIY